MTETYEEVDKYSTIIDKNFIKSYLRMFYNDEVKFKEKMLTLLKDFLNKKELYYDDEANKKVKCNLVSIDIMRILNENINSDQRPFHISPCYGDCIEGSNNKIFIEKIYTSGLTNDENDELQKLINDNKKQVTIGGKSKTRRSNKKKSNKKKRSNKKKSNKRKTHRRR